MPSGNLSQLCAHGFRLWLVDGMGRKDHIGHQTFILSFCSPQGGTGPTLLVPG